MKSAESTHSTKQTRLLITLAQALALLLLHQAIELHFWPWDSPQWLFCFYSMAVSGPILLLLLDNDQPISINLRYVLPVSALFGLLGYYTGSQAMPYKLIEIETLTASYVLTFLIMAFLTLIYSKTFISHKHLPYSMLYRHSFSSFFTLALALLFTLCVWGLLMLWATLFQAINIRFFYDLFTAPGFYYPLLTVANGLGIKLFEQSSQFLETINTILQTLMKYLLLILTAISLLFLSVLPFTGLEPLWLSGGSLLVLWIQALLLFFTNLVFQENSKQQIYSTTQHRIIYGGLAVLPVYSIISCYGLWLRIDQYGLSIERLWGILIWFILLLYSVAYTLGISRYRDQWLDSLSWTNVRLGGVVLGLLILVNSPVIDFRKLTVASQIERFERSNHDTEKLDIRYFKSDLARPGYLAIQEIKENAGASEAMLVTRINALYFTKGIKNAALQQRNKMARAALLAAIQLPQGPAPSTLLEKVLDDLWSDRVRLSSVKGLLLLPIDLNEDGQQEYLLIRQFSDTSRLGLYAYETNQWTLHPLTAIRYAQKDLGRSLEDAQSGNLITQRNDWLKLQVGNVTYAVMPQVELIK
jgi:hypothetical protein